MQYLGGKSRIAKSIAEVIHYEVSRWKVENSPADRSMDKCLPSNGGGGQVFVSLFCGTCSVESKIQGFSRIIPLFGIVCAKQDEKSENNEDEQNGE